MVLLFTPVRPCVYVWFHIITGEKLITSGNMCYGAHRSVTFWWYLTLTFDLESYFSRVLLTKVDVSVQDLCALRQHCFISFWGQKVKITAANDPKTLWTSYLKNQWREFHPILVTVVYGFTDILVSFWCQQVKRQGHSRWKNLYNIFATIGGNFTKIKSRMYLSLRHTD